jgi:hypothetical protein
MGIINNVTQSLLGMIFERTTMLIIEKRITYELIHENIKELKSIHLGTCLDSSLSSFIQRHLILSYHM